jgi:hypothetical protein
VNSELAGDVRENSGYVIQRIPGGGEGYEEVSNEGSSALTLSDPTSDLVRQYDFRLLLRCRKTSDTVFCCVCSPAVGASPTLFLM